MRTLLVIGLTGLFLVAALATTGCSEKQETKIPAGEIPLFKDGPTPAVGGAQPPAKGGAAQKAQPSANQKAD